MKKFLALASLLSFFAVSGFAQTAPARTPAEAGAKLVAERDAAWLKAHPRGVALKEPMAHLAAKQVKHVKHMKRVKHSKPAKKGKKAKSKTI